MWIKISFVRIKRIDTQTYYRTHLSSTSSSGNPPWDWTDRCTWRRRSVPPGIPRPSPRAPVRPTGRPHDPWRPCPWRPCSGYPAPSGQPSRTRSIGIDPRCWTRGRDASGRPSNGCCPPSRWPGIPALPLKHAKKNMPILKSFWDQQVPSVSFVELLIAKLLVRWISDAFLIFVLEHIVCDFDTLPINMHVS